MLPWVPPVLVGRSVSESEPDGNEVSSENGRFSKVMPGDSRDSRRAPPDLRRG